MLSKKRYMYYLLIFLLFFCGSGNAVFASDPIIDSIDEHLSEEAYFKKGTVIVRDFVDITGEVMISEEETESVKIKALYISYTEQRDRFFHFTNKEIYYYDLDHNELLSSTSVVLNDDLKSFIDTHNDELNRSINGPSLFLILFFIFSFVIIGPILTMVFHRPSSER
ncbi:hypothetical protein AAEO50_11520 [Rossellomorea oryzaecorticis]|uniref:Uncharacterized protein n=1 Tax=Rossellomorea oryzaecorticis TaxID=1396505 RepID=A0ABU9K9Z6_9BACI